MARKLIDKHWFEQRLKERELNKTQLSITMGIHASALSNILNGNRRLQLNEAIKIADALQRPLNEVLEKFGIEFGRHLGGPALLFGKVSHEESIQFFRDTRISARDLKYVNSPVSLHYNLLEIATDDAAPRYVGGDLIGIEEESDLDSCVGSEAIVGTGNDRGYFKRVQAGSAPGLFTLTSLNFRRPALVDVPLKWGYPICVHIPYNGRRVPNLYSVDRE